MTCHPPRSPLFPYTTLFRSTGTGRSSAWSPLSSDGLAVQDAAQPGARQAGDRDGDRVPERTEPGLGDCDHYTSDTGQEPDKPENQGVTHPSMGGEPRRDVAARDAEDDAVGRRQEEQRAGHRLAPGWIHLKPVEHLVGAERQDYDRDEPRGDCARAAPRAAAWRAGAVVVARPDALLHTRLEDRVTRISG